MWAIWVFQVSSTGPALLGYPDCAYDLLYEIKYIEFKIKWAFVSLGDLAIIKIHFQH